MTTKQNSTWLPWYSIGLFFLLLACGACLGQIPGLKSSRWWYPEAGFKEVWVLWWAGLYGLGAWWIRRKSSFGLGWQIAWALTLILAWSGFWNLVEYIQTKQTAGDLFYNHFLGAQRAHKGVKVYDIRGLYQSVNASPFVLALLRPFGGMSARNFLPWWLGAQSLFLLSFFAYGWVWVRWLWQGLNASSKKSQPAFQPGIPEMGVLVISTIFFNSFQRSWRLGQLDTMVLFLLTAGCFHACWYALREESRSWHGWLGGVFLAFAIGLKIAPVFALGPIVFWILLQKWRARRGDPQTQETRLALQRWTTVFLGGCAGILLVVTVSLVGVGAKESRRFFENFPKIAKGSTAGVNYSIVGRFAKYRDQKLRLRHSPLPPSDRRLLWPLRIGVVLSWIALAWFLSASHLPLLMFFGLLAIPTVSPMCWDIYYIWCANFAWFLAFVLVMGRWESIWNPAYDPPKPWVAARTKFWLAVCLLGASFYSMGLAGNSVIRSIHTMKLVDLDLPLWFDEARMVGYVLFIGLFVWLMLASQKAENRELAETGKV